MKLTIHSLFCLTVILIISCKSPDTDQQATHQQLPNVILIFADDLGYGDLSCFGQTAYTTPALDQLADEGIKLTSFYAFPACTPSRAALLTGCYPKRVGLPYVVAPKGPEWTHNVFDKGLNPEEETLAELLKEQGYATACIGKWHLGHHEEHLPTQQGFDYYFGLPYSNDMLAYKGYGRLPLMRNDSVIEYEPDQHLLTKMYTDEALNFIDKNQEQPFFLYLAHTMPHVPIYASEAYESKSGAGLYGDVIREIDGSVDEIINKLKSLQLDEQTLVIFTSDNGPWLVYGNHAGTTAGLREGKHTSFEGGMRVPFIAWWPGMIESGVEIDQIAGVIDILPTIATLTGAGLPVKKIDGKDIHQLLLTGDTSVSRQIQYFGKGMAEAVRKGDWKLHLPHPYINIIEPGTNGNMGVQQEISIDTALFDLENDPEEMNNLAAYYPEKVAELSALINEFNDELSREARPPGMAEINSIQ